MAKWFFGAFAIAVGITLPSAAVFAAESEYIYKFSTKYFTFKEPIGTITISNPGVIDASALSDRRIAVYAKAGGMSNLVVVTKDKTELLNLKVVVPGPVHIYNQKDLSASLSYECLPVAPSTGASGEREAPAEPITASDDAAAVCELTKPGR
jgi:Flp pilus assembly secretin CpaC